MQLIFFFFNLVSHQDHHQTCLEIYKIYIFNFILNYLVILNMKYKIILLARSPSSLLSQLIIFIYLIFKIKNKPSNFLNLRVSNIWKTKISMSLQVFNLKRLKINNYLMERMYLMLSTSE